jgi:hypothetical protein
MKTINRITGIEGVVEGGLGTFSIPIGPRYFYLKLFCFLDGVATAASTVVDRVRVKVNDNAIWDVSAQRLIAEAALDGITVGVGELPINFANPAAADKIDEALTAWDTFGERSVTVELSLKSAGGVPLVSGIMAFDRGFRANAAGQRIKTVIRKFESTYNLGAGLADVDTLNKRWPIQRLLMDGASNISQVDVIADSRRVWEASDTENTRILADYGLDATAFNYPLCFNFTEQLSDFLEVAQTLNVRVTSAAAQTVTILQTSISNGFDG